MKRTTTALSTTLLLLALGGAAAAQESAGSPPPDGSGGHFFVGTRGLDNANYLGKVSEYDTARQGLRPSVGTNFWIQRGSTFLDVNGEFRGDARDQQYGVDFQVGRYLRIRSYFVQFLHRLDHDPLKDFDAGKGGPLVWHEDHAPGVDYLPNYNEVTTRLEFTVPHAEWLRFHAGHRSYQRHGPVQARTIAHCSSCHVQAVTKNIDQRTHEFTGGVSLRFHNFSVDYEYLNRQFNERGETPMMLYDASIHPVKLIPIFGNRVSFDDRDGPLPFSMVPDGRKSRHSLRARAALPGDAKLSGAFTSASLTNKFTGLGADTWGWNGKFTIPIGKRLQFLTRARQTDVDADDVFVEIQEPTAIAGPHAGLTYPEAYPDFGSASFMRYSVRSRNRFSWKGELSARLARYTTLRGGYEFIRLKRDNFEIARTDTNRLYFTFYSRRRDTVGGDWSWRLRYRFDDVNDPFLHHKATLPPALQPYPSPNLSPFAGLQYYKLYAARQADLTAFPTKAHTVEPTVTWMPSMRFSASLHYRYRNLKNDELNRSEWKRSVHLPGVELWFAPLERLDFTVAYTFHNEHSESLFGIPVYDG